MMVHMWIDERGSEVLPLAECRRLLALGTKEGRHGHLGIPKEGAPLVLPVDYTVHGRDLVLRIGEGLFERLSGQLIAFQVDGVDRDQLWSVLVRGLATEQDISVLSTPLPVPRVTEPGHRVVRIRADVVTGRRLGAGPKSETEVEAASEAPVGTTEPPGSVGPVV